MEKNILFTIAYFNSMNFYPTSFEIWRHYIDYKGERRKTNFSEVIQSLLNLQEKKIIICQKGFWSIKNEDSKNDFWGKRILKQKISLSKIKKIQKWNGFFSTIPFLRSVIVNGTVAMKNASPKSDWDILTITKKNRIWLGRLFLSLALSLVGKRRVRGKIKNEFCLNHYLSENGIILEENGIFVAFLFSFSFWVYGEKIAKRFYQINSFKHQAFLPNFSFDLIESDKIKKKKKSFRAGLLLENFLERTKLAGFLNLISKNLMIKKIEKNPKTKKLGADIRFSDQALIFLPSPQRNFLLKKTFNLLKTLEF